MQGLDRTGPMGDGPMTGWAIGNCAGARVSRRRYPRGFGRNTLFDRGICYGIRRRSRGRFFSPGRGFFPGGYAYGGRRNFVDDYREDEAPEAERKYELELLKREAEYLQSELKTVKNRIDEIESTDKKEE